MHLIDISGWEIDEAFSPYPEGSRNKYALIAPADGCPAQIIPGHRYLMKFSNQRYPVQFWSELIAQIVGKQMGIHTPRTFVAVDPTTGEPGSLIEWFYGPKLEHSAEKPTGFAIGNAWRAIFGVKEEAPKTHSLYVPGSSYMTRIVPGYDLKAGTQHNFVDIAVWISLFSKSAHYDYWFYWAKMLLFDALIGNTDRHQDNWGVLWRSDDEGNLVPKFAPAFDNGTSLAHEIMENRIGNFQTEDAVSKYVDRGRHHMKWQRKDQRKCPHFELIQKITRFRRNTLEPIKSIVDLDFSSAYDEIRDLTTAHVSVPLSEARADLICRMVEQRVKKFRKVL
jgi:hypothetical protein